MYPQVFSMMIVVRVSLRDCPLAILGRDAEHARLNLCPQGYDKIHSLESPRGDRGNGPEIRPGAKPVRSPEYSPNPQP